MYPLEFQFKGQSLKHSFAGSFDPHMILNILSSGIIQGGKNPQRSPVLKNQS